MGLWLRLTGPPVSLSPSSGTSLLLDCPLLLPPLLPHLLSSPCPTDTVRLP